MDTWESRVQLFARQARDKAGSAEKLADLLAGAGIRSSRTGRTLQANTVTQWMRGIATPPGDTLLAMAKVTNLSLDALLSEGFDARGIPSLGEVESRLAATQRELHEAGRELQELRVRVERMQRDGESRIRSLEAAEEEMREFLAERARAREERERAQSPRNRRSASRG